LRILELLNFRKKNEELQQNLSNLQNAANQYVENLNKAHEEEKRNIIEDLSNQYNKQMQFLENGPTAFMTENIEGRFIFIPENDERVKKIIQTELSKLKVPLNEKMITETERKFNSANDRLQTCQKNYLEKETLLIKALRRSMAMDSVFSVYQEMKEETKKIR